MVRVPLQCPFRHGIVWLKEADGSRRTARSKTFLRLRAGSSRLTTGEMSQEGSATMPAIVGIAGRFR